MSKPFIGEIRMFAGVFAPEGWAFCDGQLLSVPQNDQLFSLLGTIYGGDGITTFALPDLRGRIPLHMGHGQGLSPRSIGSKGGEETVTLTTQQLPTHSHKVYMSRFFADDTSPSGRLPAIDAEARAYAEAEPTDDFISTVTTQGEGQPHDNLMPTLGINFIIALVGTYPSRE